MFTLFKKEIAGYFGSLTAYIVMIVFLLSLGIFVWIVGLPFSQYANTSILDYGYATLDPFFFMAPIVFIFLISAITMRSFSEELRSGTIEILVTRPLTEMQIILGKYFAAVFLVFFTLVPTLIYYFTVYQLGSPKGNLDSGSIFGSYIGLFLLGTAFTSIGIFSSSLTKNQLVALIFSSFLSIFFFIGFDKISSLPLIEGHYDVLVQNLGINEHYQSISKGVIDTRDIIYFISISALFVLATKLSLQSRKW